ncbi:MAG: DUF4416 family protein [Candidatus Aureabacteria bacterium]|nr:DUF4416 family protein [Candidatus Auribacterota bacterium]
MGDITIPQPVKLISGILAASPAWLERGKQALRGRFGEIEAESVPIPFSFSDYYRDELGDSILRQFLSFQAPLSAEDLADIKIATNEMEILLSERGKRKTNLDPGYVDLSKLVLATTKDATYRVYLGKGIYAQPTLVFREGSFRPWEWTYPDYREAGAIEFFNKVRQGYKDEGREKRLRKDTQGYVKIREVTGGNSRLREDA